MKYKIGNYLKDTDWLPNIEATYPKGLLDFKKNKHYDEDKFFSILYQSGYSLIGYQCARLTDKEIQDIKKNGLSFGGKELLYKKVSYLPKEYRKIKNMLKKHIKGLNSTQADNLIYFSYGNLDFKNDVASYKNFIENWGGESLYNYYDNGNIILEPRMKEIKDKLREISTPCIIIIRCPLKIEYDLHFKYFYEIFMSKKINTIFQSMCVNNVKPEVVDIVDLNKYSGLDFS